MTSVDSSSKFYVYAIENNSDGSIKIGRTKNPVERLYAIQNGSSAKLSIIATQTLQTLSESVRVEAEVHKVFQRHRLSGEWFSKEIRPMLAENGFSFEAGAGDVASFDLIRCVEIDSSVFGPRWTIWTMLMGGADDQGFVDYTQASIAETIGVSERQIRNHFSIFKSAGMIEKRRDSAGRSRFRICPEYFFKGNKPSRDAEVRERGKSA